MEAFLEKYTEIFQQPRPNNLLEREIFDIRQRLVQLCSKYHKIAQREPLDEDFIEMLTYKIHRHIKVIHKIQHYIDTEYIR
jgi:hypothetical protein